MTGRNLLKWLQTLTDDQLDNYDVSVSAGCDENGEAEFFTLNGACESGHYWIEAAADGVLDPGSPVLLFDQPCDEDE